MKAATLAKITRLHADLGVTCQDLFYSIVTEDAHDPAGLNKDHLLTIQGFLLDAAAAVREGNDPVDNELLKELTDLAFYVQELGENCDNTDMSIRITNRLVEQHLQVCDKLGQIAKSLEKLGKDPADDV